MYRLILMKTYLINSSQIQHVCAYTCMYICMCVCTYVCIYLCRRKIFLCSFSFPMSISFYIKQRKVVTTIRDCNKSACSSPSLLCDTITWYHYLIPLHDIITWHHYMSLPPYYSCSILVSDLLHIFLRLYISTDLGLSKGNNRPLEITNWDITPIALERANNTV